MARNDHGPRLLAANGVAPARGSLQRRIARVLDTRTRRHRAAVTWSAASAAGALLIAAPLAATTLAPMGQSPAARFTGLEIRGAGEITLRYGSDPAVTLIRGGSDSSRMSLDRGTLVIEACANGCGVERPVIEIVARHIEHITVRGGGAVQSSGRFPDQPTLTVQVIDGGLIRVGSIEAQRVYATIKGGGTIKTTVGDKLDASVRGQGSVVYWGNPVVASSVTGGGVIVHADED